LERRFFGGCCGGNFRLGFGQHGPQRNRERYEDLVEIRELSITASCVGLQAIASGGLAPGAATSTGDAGFFPSRALYPPQERAPASAAPPTVPSGTVAAIPAMRPFVGKGGDRRPIAVWTVGQSSCNGVSSASGGVWSLDGP